MKVNIKPLPLVRIIVVLIIFSGALEAQQLKVTEVKGEVKYQSGTSESWITVKNGKVLQPNGFISTGKNSFVKIEESGNKISIGEMSAVSISSIKKMTTDELLLALAMEDMINAPKTNGNESSQSTATYGEKETTGKSGELKLNDFGIKRLNGAVQLADNGLKESSVVFAKETYRKYPETKEIASFRIFFADVLYQKGLYEEAFGDYIDIQNLDLSNEQLSEVESRIDSINKILLIN